MPGLTVDQLQVLITADTADLRKGLEDTKRQLGSMASATQAPTDALRRIGDVGVTALKVGVVGAIAAVAASIPEAVRRIDTLVAFPRVLEAMGASAGEAKSSTDRLAKSLLGLPTPLQDGAKGVQQFVAAGLTASKATDTYLAMNNALLAAGGNAQDTGIVMDSLTRAFSGGSTEATTMQAALSRMPTALQALQKQTGKSAGELYKLYAANPKQLADDLVELNNRGGGGLASLEEQARAATGGIGTAFANMKNSITRGLQGIVTQLGNGDLAAGQKVLSDAITAVGKAFGDALLKVGEFFALIIANKDVFMPIAVAVGTFVAILTAMSLVLTLVSAATAIWNTVLLANPILLVIVLVASLAAGLVYFFTQTQLGSQIFASAMSLVSGAINIVVGLFNTYLLPILKVVTNFIVGQFKKAWDDITDAFNRVKATLEPFMPQLQRLMPILQAVGVALAVAVIAPLVIVIATVVAVIAIFAAVMGHIARLIGWFAQFFSAAISYIVGAWNSIRSAWSAAVGFFSGVWSGITSIFSGIGGWFRSIFQGAYNGVTSVWSNIGGFFSGIKNTIIGIFSGAGSWLADAGRRVISGFVSGVQSAFGAVKATLSKLTSMLPSWKGPAKKDSMILMNAGKLVMGGFQSGLESQFGSIESKLGKFTNNLGNDIDLSPASSAGQTIIVKIGEDQIINRVVKGINNLGFMNNESVLEV